MQIDESRHQAKFIKPLDIGSFEQFNVEILKKGDSAQCQFKISMRHSQHIALK